MKPYNLLGLFNELLNIEVRRLNLVHYDLLTKIPNRQYFEERLSAEITEHHKDHKFLAVLLIDFDDFKTVNDTLGHDTGDMLLKAATKRMIGCIREKDFIARLGGDEFVVLLNKSSASAARLVAQKIIKVLSKSFQFKEYRMKISASIGIALYPETALTAVELLRHADIAMYQAKRADKNNYAVFSKSADPVQDKRKEIIRKDLKLALIKDQLYIDYQPQIDLIDNKIVGFEAFVRWVHPKEGLILPREFISLAEQTGCIHLISQWLIEHSFQDFSNLLKTNETMKLSINISLSQLNEPLFLAALDKSLESYSINKNQIVLDVSERIIAKHFKFILKKFEEIHQFGFKISLDNFGSPDVFLPKLLTLPVHYLKLDQDLLQNIESSERHQTLLRGIINLTKELNAQPIQKGVETKEQHQIIKSLGCQYAQGFYYCRPIRIGEVLKLLDKKGNFSAI